MAAHHELSWEERQIFADTVLEMLFEDIEDHFERGEHDKVDEFLLKSKVVDTEHAILVGVLQATQEQANLLPSRSSFYHRVYEEVRRTRSEKETTALLGRFVTWKTPTKR
jgi:hypothetical protein